MLNSYQWTNHSLMKMKYYGLSQQRVRRVIKSPVRIEEGIVEKTVACMQPTSTRMKDGKKTWSQEIWAMYKIQNQKSKCKSQNVNSKFKNIPNTRYGIRDAKIKIISAWRYPGISPKQNPIPEEILDEIKNLL